MAVEGPGLKESCKEVEAWNHEESFGEVIGETATKSYVARDLSIWRCQYHGMNTENCNISGIEAVRAGKTNSTY